jgi:hypothetical protein
VITGSATKYRQDRYFPVVQGGLMKVLTIIALTAAVFAQGAPARAADCDRACLASLMDRYLVALDAHDPKLLPLARGAKFTENTVALTLGDGFWQTIDKGSQSSTSRLIIADPATSQVAFYGAAKENGQRASTCGPTPSVTRWSSTSARASTCSPP